MKAVVGILLAVVAAFLLALSTTGGSAPAPAKRQVQEAPSEPATAPSCQQTYAGRCDETGEVKTPKPARKAIPLEDQAEHVARRYVVVSRSFDGDSRSYRRQLSRLLADTSPRASRPRGLTRAKARVTSAEVQYANEMEAVVLVSGVQRIGGQSFLMNINITLTRVDGRYRVEDAQLLGGDAGR